MNLEMEYSKNQRQILLFKLKQKLTWNQRLCLIFLPLIAVILMAAGMIENGFHLKEPVFLQNYMEVPMFLQESDQSNESNHTEKKTGRANFSLYYIADQDFDSCVSYVQFVEPITGIITATETMSGYQNFSQFGIMNQRVNYQSIGLYQLHMVGITIENIDPNVDGLSLSKIRVTFSDGSWQIVDLNHVNLFWNNQEESGVLKGVQESRSYTSQIDEYTHHMEFRALQPITITQLNPDVFTTIGIDASIKINQMEYSYEELRNINIPVQTGDTFTIDITYLFGQPTNPIQIVSFRPVITCLTESGEQKSEGLALISIANRFHNQWDVKKYIETISK